MTRDEIKKDLKITKLKKNPNPFKGLFMGETWTLLEVP